MWLPELLAEQQLLMATDAANDQGAQLELGNGAQEHARLILTGRPAATEGGFDSTS